MIDYMFPLLLDAQIIYMKRPKLEPNIFSFLLPFSLEVSFQNSRIQYFNQITFPGLRLYWNFFVDFHRIFVCITTIYFDKEKLFKNSYLHIRNLYSRVYV